MSEPITINEATDVSFDCLCAAEDIYDGWFSNDERIDWDSFWDKLDKYGFSVASLDCGATKKIQRHIRKLKNEG